MPRLIKRWVALTYYFLLCIVTPALYAQDQSNDWQPSEGLVDYFVQDSKLERKQEDKKYPTPAIACFELMTEDRQVIKAMIQASHEPEWGERRPLVLEQMSNWFSSDKGNSFLLRQKELLNSSINVRSISAERTLLNMELEATLKLHPFELESLLNASPPNNVKSRMRSMKAINGFVDRHEHCAKLLLNYFGNRKIL